MPVYEYECSEHGVFEQLRSLAEYAEPAPCPACDTLAARVVSAPHLAGMPRASFIAHERNERSRHEPRQALRARDDDARKTAPERRPIQRYRGARPWVIEHG